MKKIITFVLFFILITSNCFAADKHEPLMVFAAASLSDSLNEIAVDFKKQEGAEVNFNFGGSKALALQIEKGLPCDLFFAADKDSVAKLVSDKFVDEANVSFLLENQLVIVAAIDSEEKIHTLFDLQLNKGDSLAIADPKTAPAGVYAMQALNKAGLAEKFKDNIVPSLDVRASLALVQSGNAKYAIVYATDAKISSKVKVVYLIPKQSYDRIVYTAAIIKQTKTPPEAAKFLSFLKGERSRMIFQKYGFQPFQR